MLKTTLVINSKNENTKQNSKKIQIENQDENFFYKMIVKIIKTIK